MKDNNWVEDTWQEDETEDDGLFKEDPDEVVDLRPVVEETSLKVTVLEMILMMAVWGVVCEIVILIFVQDVLGCSIGVWLGVILAAGCSVHMAWSLNMALELEAKVAQAKTRTHSMIRYVVILVVFAVILLTGVINPLATFAGIMALKVSAYFQPLAHRILKSNPRR